MTARKKVALVILGLVIVGGSLFGLWQYRGGKLFSSAATVQTFSDVPSTYWAYSQIEAAYKAGIIQGYQDGTFKPEGIVTRDQGAVFVARALAGGDSKVPTSTQSYHCRDVLPTNWAYKYVQYLFEKGVITECNDYSKGYILGASLPLTREVMSEWLAGALVGGASKVPAGPATATFKDVPTTYWAYKYIQYLSGKNIVSGYSDGTFRPLENVTRAQMAVFIVRAFPTLTTTKPSLTTQAASSITDTSATLNGTITDIGSANATNPTIRGFKYSQGTSCTNATTVKASGSFGNGAYSLPTGAVLSVGTQYSYRAFATNSAGTSYGNCVQFTTSTPTPTTATISGKVTDSAGNPLSNGYLVLEDDIIKINSDGTYTDSGLEATTYDVEIFDQNGNLYESPSLDAHIISPSYGNNTINFSGLVKQ